MPLLASLSLNNFRNLQTQTIDFCDGLNVVYGENGSGKSSLLEAIYLLGTGRSLRLHKLDEAIALDASSFRIQSQLQSNINSYKDYHEAKRLKGNQAYFFYNNNAVKNSSQLAKILPVLCIDVSSFQLLSGGPKLRRKFIDWGTFHIKSNYGQLNKDYNQALLQRNQLLKRRLDDGFNNQLSYWNNRLANYGSEIDKARKNYIARYLQRLNELLEQLETPFKNVSIKYQSGWDAENISLEKALIESQAQDEKYHNTHKGPHRADLNIEINNKPVVSFFSRGQQKLFIYILILAQSVFYKEVINKNGCCVLIDDFCSEFDERNQAVVLDVLNQYNNQCFLTVIDEKDVVRSLNLFKANKKKFHVKQGLIQ